MWYVIQVKTGTEESIQAQCSRVISKDILPRSFILYYDRMRRYQGQWHKERHKLFPGYVFLETEAVDTLFHQLKKVIGLTKVLGTGQEIVPLTAEEEALILHLSNDEQVVPMSEGIIEGDKITITKGPLEGMEAYIKRIDRHKRLAYLEVPMMGTVVQTQVGLEVVAKR